MLFSLSLETPFSKQNKHTMRNLEEENIILFPSIGMGHLIPMVELAKSLINQNFSVTIIIASSPFIPSLNSSYISHISSTYPSISFQHLPEIPPSELRTENRMLANFDILRLSNPHLSNFASQVPNIRAIFLDMFCTYALEVARNLNIPPYIFFASCASALIAFVLMPTIQSQITTSFKELGKTPLNFPGLPPIPASDMPSHFHVDLDSDEYKGFVYHMTMFPKADGILINTFEVMEKSAVEALNDGKCFPGRPMPPTYCVGPLISDGGGESRRHGCMTWLDAQPEGGVVFLCFGSLGAFSKEQLQEVAVGLERSGHRFLWVVKDPAVVDRTKRIDLTYDVDLEGLLPEGFLERTKKVGMVVKTWAPQAEVLRHKSVGGFVSHCGWNSTLEAVCAGVPIIAWPLYAEQRMNKVFLTEVKIAVEMEGYDEEVVRAEEVEGKVRWLMESEEGKELKDKARSMKEAAWAAKAKQDGGSSSIAWANLMTRLRENSLNI